MPENDVHRGFVDYACEQLSADERSARVFRRLSDMGGIDHRFSFIRVFKDESGSTIDEDGVYTRGAFPDDRRADAPLRAVRPDPRRAGGREARTGRGSLEDHPCGHDLLHRMSAPGVDLQIAERCGLPGNIERTSIGFMGCYAAVNAMKVARHIVRSEPDAKVLMLNLELCTLHLKESTDVEQILSFFLFADGCAASLITAEPTGVALDSFHAVLAPETQGHITWNVGDSGFDMLLSGKVPGAIRQALREKGGEILRGIPKDDIDLWAIHPGGRTVLDAVQTAMELPDEALWASRGVLRDYGNMSSPSSCSCSRRSWSGPLPASRGARWRLGRAWWPRRCSSTRHDGTS